MVLLNYHWIVKSPPPPELFTFTHRLGILRMNANEHYSYKYAKQVY